MKINDFLRKNGCEEKLAQLLSETIPAAIKRISAAIQTQGTGFAGSQNVYGEDQLALDVQANQIVLDELKKSGLVASAASEELESIISLQSAPYTVVFDPLDGSSLVDVNFAVGSIFGIYPAGDPIGKTGDEQLAACFAVYGPRTTLVLTVKKGSHEFRLGERIARARGRSEGAAKSAATERSPSLNLDGNFYLSKENLRIEAEAKHFAPGNLRAAAEREDYLKLTNEWIKNGLTLRYSGGMVPDINHILLKGNGIFTYPSYSKTPEGKLRLLFECNPITLLIEQAGGAASDGTARILSKKIVALHQRTPIYAGSSCTVKHATEKLTQQKFLY